jgi:hypothetical protein
MRSNKIILALGLLILGVTATGSALARPGWHGHHHSRFSFGLSLGAPWYYPGPYYAPYYYAPYPAYAPYPYYGAPPAAADAPAYIERGDSGAPAYVEREEGAPPARRRSEGSWYFCPESNAYYPYVRQCAGGWQRVAPRPPAGPGAEQ